MLKLSIGKFENIFNLVDFYPILTRLPVSPRPRLGLLPVALLPSCCKPRRSPAIRSRRTSCSGRSNFPFHDVVMMTHKTAGDAQPDSCVPHSPEPKARQENHVSQREAWLSQ